MVTINKLTAVDSVSSSDAVPIYSSEQGDARKASMSVIEDYMYNSLYLNAINSLRPESILNTVPTTTGYEYLTPDTTTDKDILFVSTFSTVNTFDVRLPNWTYSSHGRKISILVQAPLTVLALDVFTYTGSVPLVQLLNFDAGSVAEFTFYAINNSLSQWRYVTTA